MTRSLTICIPAYNEEANLERTVQHVLNQTFSDFYVHIIDNCSSDATLAIARRLAAADSRITVHSNTINVGGAQNFQRAYWLADTEFVMLKSANDEIAPDYVATLLDVLKNDSRVAIAYAKVEDPSSVGLNRIHTVSGDPIERFAHVVQNFHSGHVLYGITRRAALDWASPVQACMGTDHICVAEAALFGHVHRVDRVMFHRTPHAPRSNRRMQHLCSHHLTRAIEELPRFGTELSVTPPFLELLESYYKMIDLARVENATKQKLRTVCTEIIRARFGRVMTEEVGELLQHTTAFLNHAQTNGVRIEEQLHASALAKAWWIAGMALPEHKTMLPKVLQALTLIAAREAP